MSEKETVTANQIVKDILTLIKEDGQPLRAIQHITSQLIDNNLNKEFVGMFLQDTFFNEEDENEYLNYECTGVNPLVGASIMNQWYLTMPEIIQSEQGLDLEEILSDLLYDQINYTFEELESSQEY